MQNSEQKKNLDENSDLQNSDPPKNVTQKENLRSLKLHHDYFNCLTLSKYIGKLITTISKFRKRKKNASFAYVIHKIIN